MKAISRIIPLIFVLFLGSNLFAKNKRFKVPLTSEYGNGHYIADGQKTELELKLEEKCGLGPLKITIKKEKYFLYADPERRIYKQNGNSYEVPFGKRDILTAARLIIDTPNQSYGTDTQTVFVDKIMKRVIFTDSLYYPERDLKILPADSNGLGGGIKGLDFHFFYFSEKMPVPLYVKIYHEKKKDPVEFNAGEPEEF